MNKEAQRGALLYLIVFFILLVTPQRNVHSNLSKADIIAHISGFFLLYFVLRKGLDIKTGSVFLITSLVAVFTEGLQYFIPWRHFALLDLVSDLVGILFACLLDSKKGILTGFVATFGFAGYIPLGPGTFAAFITSVLILVLKPSFLFILEALALVLFSGWVASSLYSSDKREDDPKEVVIDEVAGVMTAILFVPRISLFYLGLAFVLFRLYDIIKPFGIRKVEKIGGGLGIMLDDEIAGIYAGITLILLTFMLNKGGIL